MQSIQSGLAATTAKLEGVEPVRTFTIAGVGGQGTLVTRGGDIRGISLAGGTNLLPDLPAVSVEQVVSRNPHAIVIDDAGSTDPDAPSAQEQEALPVFANNLALALGLLLIFQYTNSLVIINGITLRQRLTPDRLQGRVNVTARMIAWGGQPFGAALGGLVADRLSISLTYLILTIGIATGAVFAWFSPLRKADTAMIDRLLRDVE